MAYYLVRAQPKAEHLAELGQLLAQGAFQNLRPFGEALSTGLNNARADFHPTLQQIQKTAD